MFKDSLVYVLLIAFTAFAPGVLPLPLMDLHSAYYMLSSVFQGFAALLGLLAIFAVYRAQSFESQALAHEELLREYIGQLGLNVSYRNVEHLQKIVQNPREGTPPKTRQIMEEKRNVIDSRIGEILSFWSSRREVLAAMRAPMYFFGVILMLSLIGLLLSGAGNTSNEMLWRVVIVVAGMAGLGITRGIRFCLDVAQEGGKE